MPPAERLAVAPLWANNSPKKEYVGVIRFFSPICSLKFRVLKLKFLVSPEGPGGFRKVRGPGRNHFHLSWYLSVSVVTSCEEINYFFSILSGVRFVLKNLG